jgi:hypothetical protein
MTINRCPPAIHSEVSPSETVLLTPKSTLNGRLKSPIQHPGGRRPNDLRFSSTFLALQVH